MGTTCDTSITSMVAPALRAAKHTLLVATVLATLIQRTSNSFIVIRTTFLVVAIKLPEGKDWQLRALLLNFRSRQTIKFLLESKLVIWNAKEEHHHHDDLKTISFVYF